MSPRRKKSPAKVSVEAVLWHDADYKIGSKLDTTPVFNHTVGFLVHEDDSQIVLAHEVSMTEDWMEGEMDYTKVPKQMIVSRTQLAEVAILKEGEDG